MARHWLPVQGFDEDLADRVFGVSVGKFEAMSNAEEVEEDPTDPPPALKKATTTPQKRQAAPQKPSPRKKNPVAANAAISSGEPTMAKNKERKEPTIKPNPKVTTTTPEEGRAPTAPESGMNKKGETTPTRIIKPDPDQGTTTPTPTSKKKQEKKTNPKASVAAEEMSTPSPKSSKAKTSNVPMPTSWAEAGVADRMLVTMRDNGDDWAKIRKQWKELTGLDTAASTLPTRYSRLKAGMTVLEDGDAARLVQAKDQVELRLQTEKYAMIADTVEQLGGKRYSNAFIRKEVKRLEKPGVAAVGGIKGEKSEENL